MDERDDTVEMPVGPRAASIEIPQPPLRASLVLGVLTAALFVLCAAWPRGSNDARGETPAHLPLASAMPDRPDVPLATPAAQEPVARTVSLTDDAATEGLAPSAARRECMAQIGSAHLFRQIASQSSDRSNYSRAASAQIRRMVKARPVGPRTLSRIAERMWEQRSTPDRGAAWWSTQFSRCEEARTGGTWYVVRG
jgi:hypothetical protein